MLWLVSLQPEVEHRLDQRFAEVPQPDMVDGDTRGERVVSRSDPPRQRQPAAGADRRVGRRVVRLIVLGGFEGLARGPQRGVGPVPRFHFAQTFAGGVEVLLGGCAFLFVSAGRGYPAKAMRNMARDEIQAVVDAAHGLGARVRAHVCDKALMLECIELGVDVIDHGDDIDEQVIEAMVKAGTFWVPSLVYPKVLMDMNMADATLQAQYHNARSMVPVAQKAGVRILISDDYSGVFRDVLPDDPLDHKVGDYGREFAFYGAMPGLSPAEVLSWGTANAGEALTGGRDRLGVIEAGALADLIVVDGDPLADLSILARPNECLKALIRDGKMTIDRISRHPAAPRSLITEVAA